MDLLPYIAISISILTLLWNMVTYRRNAYKDDMEKINKCNTYLLKEFQRLHTDSRVLTERVNNEMLLLARLERQFDDIEKVINDRS